MKKAYALILIILSANIQAQILNFPDANLKNALLNTNCVDTTGDYLGDRDADLNNDGEIEISEALTVQHLYLSNHSIASLSGLEAFANLTKFVCSVNQLTTIDATPFTQLKWLNCSNNPLTNLNVQNLSSLTELDSWNTQLTTINLSGLNALEYLSIVNNQLATIDLTPLTSAWHVDLTANPLTDLNIDGMQALQALNISYTQISQIDCGNSGVMQLTSDECPNLTFINVKNGRYSFSDPDLLFFAFHFYNCPLLTGICMDSGEESNLYGIGFDSDAVTIYSGTNCATIVPFNPQSTQDFSFDDYLTMAPNPATTIISLEVKQSLSMESFTIHNMLGQMVQTKNIQAPEALLSIDVSELNAGIYFLEIVSDKGKSTKKFVKL